MPTPEPGTRIVYSAGFNVNQDLTSTGRIDEELEDLGRLVSLGARVAILAHQGDWADRTATELRHVATYLSGRLGTNVGYEPDPLSDSATKRGASMAPGEIVLFGNTRLTEGEQRNDEQTAWRFAQLGQVAIIGGFSKVHRANASNLGLLHWLPGWPAMSLLRALDQLRPWSRPALGRRSVAVLGGTKPEKSRQGLALFVEAYDAVIPTGAVLHHCLRALGFDTGRSELGRNPVSSTEACRNVLTGPYAKKVRLPEAVVVYSSLTGGAYRVVKTGGRLEPDDAIVDVIFGKDLLDYLTNSDLRVVAGTPCVADLPNNHAIRALCEVLARDPKRNLLLGGDTVHDIRAPGQKSTGGGAALAILGHGTTPLIEELRRQARQRLRVENVHVAP